MSHKPMIELEFREVAAPAWATPGASVYEMLPPLADLVGCAGFGRQDPIVLPGAAKRFNPREFFAPFIARRLVH